MSEISRNRHLRKVIRAFLEVYWRNEIPLRAAGISYFIFFSLIPIFTTIVSILVSIPYWKIEVEQAIPHLTRWLLPNVLHEVKDYIQIFAAHAGVVSVAGIVVATWLLMKIVFFLEETLNRIWLFESVRSPLRIVKKGLLGCLFLVVAVALRLRLPSHGLEGVVLELIEISLFFLVFNKFIPRNGVGWRRVVPGSIVGGIAWYVTKWGFTAYIHHFAKADQIYAMLGILPLFFLWLHFSVVILLFSACLNFSLFQHSLQRTGDSPDSAHPQP